MYIRRNVWDQDKVWSEQVLWYARAVGKLKGKALDDHTSWRFWAGIHGYDEYLWAFYGYKTEADRLPDQSARDLFWFQCQHGSWYFLPWHRGYLLGFERLIRKTIKDLGGPDGWALPYWNYFKKGQNYLPAAFASPDWPDGKGNNPLFVEERWGPDPDTPGPVDIPPNIISLDALAEPVFTGVAKGGSTGFGGVETGFEHGGEWHGALESNPHDLVHVLTGGSKLFPGSSPKRLPGLMSVPYTAALDPIFWLHHCNIDRLWHIWTTLGQSHKNPTTKKWEEGPRSFGQPPFLLPLSNTEQWEYTPKEMVSLVELGYTYDDLLPPEQSSMMMVAEPVSPITPEVAMTPPIVELVGSVRAVPVVGTLAEAQVPLNTLMRAKVANKLRATASLLETGGNERERVLLNLENVTGYSDATVLRVVVQFPGRDGVQPNEQQVGAVGLFGVTSATKTDEGHGDGLSYVLDITKPYREFAGSRDIDLASLTVLLLPIAPVDEASEVRIGCISIVRQGE